MLISLNQKVPWRAGGLISPLSWTQNATGKKSGPNPFGYSRGTRETRIPPKRGKLPVRGADRDAGKGMRKKQMPSGNRMDRDCNITPRESGQTSARSFMTRILDENDKGGKADDSGITCDRIH
jgi:hypothetical protein